MSSPRPPRGLSSSSLRALSEWCPAALDYADAGAPADRSIFAVGTAAHAMLEALHEEASRVAGAPIPADRAREIAAAVGAHLVHVGRAFDGVPEPPTHPDAIGEAMGLALDWLAHQSGQLDPATEAERSLAVDPEWRPCSYRDPDALWRGVLDVARPAYDEDLGPGLESLDYKTAWPTGPDAVNTLQLRGQSCLLVAHADRFGVPDPAFVTRTVVNLRTRRTFTATLDLDADAETMLRWRAEIEALVKAAPKRGPDGRRPHRPGPGCMTCPYRATCTAAPPEATDDVADLARRWAVVTADAAHLAGLLRAVTAEGPVVLDRQTLGWHGHETARLAPGAAETLASLWLGTDAPDPAVVGLLARVLGVTGARGAVAALYRRRPADQQAALDRLLTTETAVRWGLRKEDNK